VDWTAITIGVVSSVLTTVAMGLTFVYFIINRSDTMRRELHEKIDSESKGVYLHIGEVRKEIGEEARSLRRQLIDVRSKYVSHDELNPKLNAFQQTMESVQKDIRAMMVSVAKLTKSD